MADNPLSPQKLQRQFIIVDSNPPSSPFEGQIWRDTSTSTTKQYDSGSWVSIQASPDEITLTKNQNGELEIKQKVIDHIGRFNGSLDGWSETYHRAGDGSTSYSSGKEDQCRHYSTYNDGNYEPHLKKTVDLTDREKLKFWYYQNTNNYQYGTGELYIGGTEELVWANVSAGSWVEIEIDVSGYSGSKDIFFRWEDHSGTYSPSGFDWKIDDIRLIGGTNPAIKETDSLS